MAKSSNPILTSSFRFVNTPGMGDFVESCHLQSGFTSLDLADTTKVASAEPTDCGSHVHMDILVHEGKAYRTSVFRNAASETELLLKSEAYDSEKANWIVQGELPFPAIQSVLQAVCCKAKYLEIAAVLVKKVERLVSSSNSKPLQIHQFQCQYVGDKLMKAIECAQLDVSCDKHVLHNVCKKLCHIAEEVERIVLDCSKEQWLHGAVTTLTGFTENLSEIIFELEVCSAILRDSLKSGEELLLKLRRINATEIGIMKEKAAADWGALLEKIHSAQIVSTDLSSEKRQIAEYVVKRRQICSSEDMFDEDIWKVDSKSLKRLAKIGRGSSASVHTTVWCGIQFAEKYYSLKDAHEVKHEVFILSKLSHPNIVSLVCYAMGTRHCSLVMERMDEDLHQLMERKMECADDKSTPFELLEAVYIMRQIAEGMDYLHDHKVIHRDLKSANILVKFGKKDRVDVKVADFGLSKVKELSRTPSVQTKNKGTTRWMAPELFQQDIEKVQISDKTNLKYHFKCDIYSFGMVCYEVLTGEVPFAEVPLRKIREFVLNGERPELPKHCPEELADLIKHCWDSNPSERPSFSEICWKLTNLHFSLLTDILFQPSHPAEIDDSIFSDAEYLKPLFIKSSTHEILPMGYCLATLQDIHKNREALLTTIPGWEIACLADGWVDGACYGGCFGLWDGEKHTHKPWNLGDKVAVLCSQCRSCMVAAGDDLELTTLMEIMSQMLRKNISTGNSPFHHLSTSDPSANCSSTEEQPSNDSTNNPNSRTHQAASACCFL